MLGEKRFDLSGVGALKRKLRAQEGKLGLVALPERPQGGLRFLQLAVFCEHCGTHHLWASRFGVPAKEYSATHPRPHRKQICLPDRRPASPFEELRKEISRYRRASHHQQQQHPVQVYRLLLGD